MEIISLSIDDETLAKIDEIEAEASFNGRSELIRKAISNLHEDLISRRKLEGALNAVVVVRHPHNAEGPISEISHRHDDVITTQLHSKLDNEKCLEIFHTEGSARDVIEFSQDLEGSKHTESVRLLPQDQ